MYPCSCTHQLHAVPKPAVAVSQPSFHSHDVFDGFHVQASFVDGKQHVIHWVVYVTATGEAEASTIGQSVALTFPSAGPPTSRSKPEPLTFTSTSVWLPDALPALCVPACLEVHTGRTVKPGRVEKFKHAHHWLTANGGSVHELAVYLTN